MTDINIPNHHLDYFDRVLKQGTEASLHVTSPHLPADIDTLVLYALDIYDQLFLLADENAVPSDVLAVRFAKLKDARDAMSEEIFLEFEKKLAFLME